MELLVAILFVVIIGGLFSLVIRGQIRISNNIEKEILDQSKDRGLRVKRIINPGTNQWKYSPFEHELKIGTLGFYGIRTNEEYYRIIVYEDSVTMTDRYFWIKAINDKKAKMFSYEWREEANSR